MSSIDRLSIQGIRSFGANTGDSQTICFISPITLILGENGCGKTTIIECLKHVLTGEFPPGSDKGKNFIHDPKISCLNDSLGQIKLEVRNIQGSRLSISRSMKVGMKRGKSTFETLDATLNYLDNGGKRQGNSISKRCSDVNLIMSQFMGVSKAIINNVLFCHQEDSSWPLDEPKKLKEKFDAIFGITDYDKALDRIIKMRKEEMNVVKIKESELKFALHLKQEMEAKTLNLQTYREKAKSIEEQCLQCDGELKPIEYDLQKIFEVESEVGKFQAQKIELQTKQKNCQDQIVQLKKKIKNPFEGSLNDLDVEISLFKERMIQKHGERRQIDDNLNALNKQASEMVRNRNDTEKKRALLEQQQLKENDCKRKLAEQIKVLCEKLKIPTSVDLIQDTQGIANLLADVQAHLEGEQCRITETIEQHDHEDQERQTKIDQLRVNITKLKESLEALRKQKISCEKESEQNEQKILEVDRSTKQLKVVAQKLKEAEDRYEDTLNRFQQHQLKKSINQEEEQIKRLEEQFRHVDERLDYLNSMTQRVAEIQLKEKELNKQEQQVRRVKAKHSDNFHKVFAQPVEAQFKRHLQQALDGFKSQVKQFNDQLNVLKLKQQSCEMKRKGLKGDIQELKKELEDGKERIYEICHDTPYEELLLKAKAALNSCQLELGAQTSAEALYKKYLQQIEDEAKAYCPLCHKNMSGDEASKLITDLNEEIQQLPQNIKKAEQQLKLEQKKYENMLHLKPILDKVNKLEVDIPVKEEELKNAQKQISDYASECEDLQLSSAEPTFNMEVATSMMGDMSLLDEAIKDATHLKADLAKLKAQLPQGFDSDNISTEEVKMEKNTINNKLKERRKQLENYQQTYEHHMETLNKLRELKNDLKSQQIKLQEGIQSLPEMQERQKQLGEQLVTVTGDIQQRQTELPPVQRELDKVISEKTKLKEAQRLKVKEMQKTLEKYKCHYRDIQMLHKEINEYRKLNLVQELLTVDGDLSSCEEQLKRCNENIKQLSGEVEAIKMELMNQESVNRDLVDNRELKILEAKLNDLIAEYEALSKQLGHLNFRNMTKEKAELNAKREQITVRKGELQGQRGEINHQIRQLEKELKGLNYRDALVNYRRTYYEVQISRKVRDDLGQHRVALEWALMQFHSEKMKEINRLIREYWRIIYRGNDIDYIEIQTDNDEDRKRDTINAAMDRRRSYNYRVVQSKNNSVIEMRGRCSAGQRVLASLIIRMALAETFSSNCGVLALDEPTTNLDSNNIQSLCAALNRIVEERKMQSNFMLIIITHDETFITSLCKVNKYYRISRNDECKSVINRVEG